MFEDIRSVRKRAGLTQGELAARAGMDRPNISAMESGRRTMSTTIADRVLEALDEVDAPSSADLVIANRLRAFQIAKKKGDFGRMLDCTRAVIKAGAATPEALPLFEEMVSEVERGIDEEDDDDGRDLFGRVRPVLKGSEDEDDGRDLYGRVVSSPSGDDDDDGRDLFGRVIRPVDQDGEDEDDEDDEDDDDGRDVFGRVVRSPNHDGIEEDNRDMFGRKIGA